MLIVQDILVSDDVVKKRFVCNLNACKGACCWEGDWGAPLETEELHTLERVYAEVKPFLRDDGIQVLEKELFTWYEDAKDYGTPLLENGACAYLTYEKDGTAKCGIEKAYEAGATDFRKPISCHLYPIRVKKDRKTNFEAINYDQWDICSAACTLGEKLQVPVYQFLKDALVRKYGEAFYEELAAAASYLDSDDEGEDQ